MSTGKPIMIASTPHGPPNSYLRRGVRWREETRKGTSNVRVVLIELLVPLLTLVGDFYEVFFLGRLRRPLMQGG